MSGDYVRYFTLTLARWVLESTSNTRWVLESTSNTRGRKITP
jgi:hypothetical protein